MARPNVSVSVTNGNLNLTPASNNGVTVVLVAAPAAPTAGYGVAFEVKSIAQVKAAFAHANNAPVVAAFEKGFFAEAPEGTKVFVLAMAQTTTLETLVAAANADKALNKANGEARLLVAIKFPADNYTPTTTEGFDVDVHNAVTDAQTLAEAWQLQKKGFRYFIEGYGYTAVADAKDYSATTNRQGHIVVGSIDNSTAIATMIAVGRAAAIPPQRNIGRVKNGSLKIAAASVVKIGTALPEDVASVDLNTLHTKRYITFEKNAISSGYVFNDDNSLTAATDDYNNLRYGRVIDNAQRITFKTYYKELKDDVDVDGNGRLDTVVEKALEAAIEGAIDEEMRGQLSKKADGSADVFCLVNPDPIEYAALYAANNIENPNLNIIEAETVYIFPFLKPKGCLKYLNAFLALTSTSS
jgi:hypothetical protein